MCYSPGILSFAILFLILQQDHSSDKQLEPLTIIPLENQQSINNDSLNLENQQNSTPEKVFVDIKGAVKYPGVYELTSENRIIDVIEMAGGYTKEADAQFINHAQKLQDEMAIFVPTIGEMVEDIQPESFISVNTSNHLSEDVVNINLASEAELATLPGVGPSKARAIISYRDENGRFQTIEDLKNVSGIGDKTFEKLKEFISVN